MNRKPLDDVRDLELGALLKTAVSAQVDGMARRIPSRSLVPYRLLPFAAALVVAVGGVSLGHSVLVRGAALRNSLAFAQDILRESPSTLYFELFPPRGRDAEVLAGFIDDLWAEPEGGVPQ